MGMVRRAGILPTRLFWERLLGGFIHNKIEQTTCTYLKKIHELLEDWLKALPVLGLREMSGTDVTCF